MLWFWNIHIFSDQLLNLYSLTFLSFPLLHFQEGYIFFLPFLFSLSSFLLYFPRILITYWYLSLLFHPLLYTHSHFTALFPTNFMNLIVSIVFYTKATRLYFTFRQIIFIKFCLKKQFQKDSIYLFNSVQNMTNVVYNSVHD